MATLNVIEYPEAQIKTVSLNDTAWLLDVEMDTLLSWVDRGVIEAVDNYSDSNIEFRREDVANLLAMFGA